jgi:hypothetical protein
LRRAALAASNEDDVPSTETDVNVAVAGAVGGVTVTGIADWSLAMTTGTDVAIGFWPSVSAAPPISVMFVEAFAGGTVVTVPLTGKVVS